MLRPFRFAVQSFSATSAKEWRARRAEALGYSALHLADHVLGPGPAIAKSNQVGAYFTFVQPGAERIADGMGQALGLTQQEMLRHPHGLFGSADAVCDELQRRRETYGISYVTVGDNALDAFAPVVARLSGK